MTRLPLYEDVASRVTALIDEGAFHTGERIPSVRNLSRQLQVSVTTVLEAYRLLEDRGLIEAKPQSGYYVRVRFPSLGEPRMSEPRCAPAVVSTRDLAITVLSELRDSSLLQFGVAIPNPSLLPLDKLSKRMVSVMRDSGQKAAAIDSLRGYEPLRVQIARRLLDAGCTVTPDEIVTTVGTMEALSFCLRATCEPGDTVAIESPMYYGILQALDTLRLRALEIPTHPRDGLCLDALTDALDRNRVSACIAITNFSNPVGSKMPDEKKRALVELLGTRGIPLIEDDIYGELSHGTPRPIAAKSFDRTGNVLYCSSFSKTIAPGYRVGWVVPGRFRDAILHQKLSTTLATPTPPQMAVAMFLKDGGYDHHLRRIRHVYARKVADMAQAVARYFPDGTRVSRPSGGYVLWVEMPERVDSLQLFHLARARQMTIAPGPMFSAESGYRNCIRLNSAFWSEDVASRLAWLGTAARELADA